MDIICSAPYIETHDNQTRLCCNVSLPGLPEQVMWYGVPHDYAQYLTSDRCDAFAAVLIPYAMRSGCDIRCEAPVSRKLLYQVNRYLIPAYNQNLPTTHPCKIIAEPASPVAENAGAVVSGWTGGVDSLYTLMHSINSPEPGYRLTHLFLLNCGTLEGDKLNEKLRFLVDRAQGSISKDTGLPVVGIDSNIHEILKERFLTIGTFRISGVAFALQKLIKTYLFSSSRNNTAISYHEDDGTYNEIYDVQMLRTDSTTIYSAHKQTRPEKLHELSEFPLAYRYLHPCAVSMHKPNCMHCPKCIKTALSLYALGTLSRFSQVFDYEYFNEHKVDYIAAAITQEADFPIYREILDIIRQNPDISSDTLSQAEKRSKAMKSVYAALSQNMSIADKLRTKSFPRRPF